MVTDGRLLNPITKNIPIYNRLRKNNSLFVMLLDCVKLNLITPAFLCYYAFRPVLPELLESKEEVTAVPRRFGHEQSARRT